MLTHSNVVAGVSAVILQLGKYSKILKRCFEIYNNLF